MKLLNKKNRFKLGLYLCLAVIISASIMPLKVLAIDVDFYSSNDILFYNPDGGGCPDSPADGSGGGGGSSSDAGYDKRLETALNFFTGKGLSLAAAAGIAGNLKNESGIEPAKIQGQYNSLAPDTYKPVNGTGFGIAQWTFSGRQGPLVAYAKSQNKKITDLTMQLEFLWKEATSNTYKDMMTKLNTIKSDTPYNGVDPAVAATILFHGSTKKIRDNPTIKKVNPKRGFEGSADSADRIINKRGGSATKIFEKYKGKIADGTGVSGIGKDPGGGGSASDDAGGECGNGAIAGDIVATALKFALDKPATSGMSKKEDATPAYIEAINTYNRGANVADCGMFVGTVMRASGSDDNYPKSSTATQIAYVKVNTDKYQTIENPKQSDLQSGDILIVNNGSSHHTMIYTGNTPYPAVDASQDDRVPSVRSEASLKYMLGLDGLVAARLIK